MNQHWAPQTFQTNVGRNFIAAVTAVPILPGAYVPTSPALNGKDFIAIGMDESANNFSIIKQNGDWFDVSYCGDKSLVGGYRGITDLGCAFVVNTPTTASINLTFDYMLSPWQKYFTMNSALSGFHQYYAADYHIPRIILLGSSDGDGVNPVVIDRYDLRYNLNSSSLAVNFNKNYILDAGSYSLNMAWFTHYQGQSGLIAWSYKNMNFNIASENRNNINVTKNTWDIHKMFTNPTTQVNKWSRPDNIGPATVSRTSTNLTTTTRFNGVKL
jgi:hypothetical protein